MVIKVENGLKFVVSQGCRCLNCSSEMNGCPEIFGTYKNTRKQNRQLFCAIALGWVSKIVDPHAETYESASNKQLYVERAISFVGWKLVFLTGLVKFLQFTNIAQVWERRRDEIFVNFSGVAPTQYSYLRSRIVPMCPDILIEVLL